MAWRFFLGFERFGPVCGVQDASRSRTDARPARQRARLALCRRLAPRRGAPPAGAAFGRPLWASAAAAERRADPRSEEHTSELQSLMRISYAVFCLKKKKPRNKHILPSIT